MPLVLKFIDNHWHAYGSVAGQRFRKSLGTSDRKQAEILRAQLEAKLWKRQAFGDEAIRTFEEAVLSYIEQGGEKRFLRPLLLHFQGRVLSTIKPGDIKRAAKHLYPSVTPATLNRQAITPAKAIINHGAEQGWCQRISVESFPVPRSQKHTPVDRAWLDAFMTTADRSGRPHLSAAVLFMHQTGARRAETVRLLGSHVNLAERIAVLERTKTDEMSVRHLTSELVVRIGNLNLEDDKPVFGYALATSVNHAMKVICERANIPVRSTHSAGRHSFATNAMQLPGARIKAAMEAGGWKSANLFMQTYVHDHSAGKEIAQGFDRILTGNDTPEPEDTEKTD